MNLIKKICALGCAGALSLAMLAAMPASGYDYESMGNGTLRKSEMSSWSTTVKYIYTNSSHGNYLSGELKQLGCSGTDYVQASSIAKGSDCYDNRGNWYYLKSHQSRVRSGGKFKESPYRYADYLAISDRIAVKNGSASFEAYYRYYLN